MEELLIYFKDNFALLAIVAALPAGQGLYNLYRGYKLSRREQHNERILTERPEWTLCIGKIMLLIAILLLTILCGIGLLLRVQLPEILALVIGSVLMAPIHAIGLLFVYKPKHINVRIKKDDNESPL